MENSLIDFLMSGQFSRQQAQYLATFLGCEEGQDIIAFLVEKFKDHSYDFFGQGLKEQGYTEEQIRAVLDSRLIINFGEAN